MNRPQGDVIPMANKSQPNKETQEFIRLFHMKKKTLSILSYNDLTDESVRPVLDTFAGYEPNHESPRLSGNNARDAIIYLINISTDFQNPSTTKNPTKQ